MAKDINDNNVILVGFKSSGKTEIGRRIASLSNREFLDVDKMICADFDELNNRKLLPWEIYGLVGSEGFSALEAKALSGLEGKNNLVISTAGSTPLNHSNRCRLRSLGLVFFLDTPATLLKRRWTSGRLPIFIDQLNVQSSMERVLASRHPIYQSIADHVVNVEFFTIDELARRIKEISDG
jgi:shikimate kinase